MITLTSYKSGSSEDVLNFSTESGYQFFDAIDSYVAEQYHALSPSESLSFPVSELYSEAFTSSKLQPPLFLPLSSSDSPDFLEGFSFWLQANASDYDCILDGDRLVISRLA